MKKIIATIGLSAYVLPMIAFGARLEDVTNVVGTGTLTRTEVDQLYRTCHDGDERQQERCRVRQNARLTSTSNKASPTKAIEIYDRLDLGNNKLREEIKKERLIENAKRWSQTRKTYREFTVEDTLNSQRRSYVEIVRYERLQCMLKPPGRQRSRCMDELGNAFRKEMREQRGSLQTPSE